MRKALDYIGASHKGDITVEDIASAAGVSAPHLLLVTEKSVKEISANCGFNDVNNFCVCFKKNYISSNMMVCILPASGIPSAGMSDADLPEEMPSCFFRRQPEGSNRFPEHPSGTRNSRRTLSLLRRQEELTRPCGVSIFPLAKCKSPGNCGAKRI